MTLQDIDGLVSITVWLVACIAGIVAAWRSMLFARRLLEAVIDEETPRTLIEGMRHIYEEMIWLVGGWVLFLTVGVIAWLGTVTTLRLAREMFQISVVPDSTPQPAATPIGEVVRWMLVLAIILWSYKTVGEYRFTSREWRKNREAAAKALAAEMDEGHRRDVSTQLDSAVIDSIASIGSDTNERVQDLQKGGAQDKLNNESRFTALEQKSRRRRWWRHA